MSHFVIDSNIRFSVTIKDFDGNLIDPATLALELKPSRAAKITYTFGVDAELVKDGTGSYHVDHIVSQAAGEWQWRWIATGTGAGADAGRIKVEPWPGSL